MSSNVSVFGYGFYIPLEKLDKYAKIGLQEQLELTIYEINQKNKILITAYYDGQVEPFEIFVCIEAFKNICNDYEDTDEFTIEYKVSYKEVLGLKHVASLFLDASDIDIRWRCYSYRD